MRAEFSEYRVGSAEEDLDISSIVLDRLQHENEITMRQSNSFRITSRTAGIQYQDGVVGMCNGFFPYSANFIFY